jgi:Flp pilus assembly protein TadD
VYVTGQPENENGNPCAIAEYREVVRLRPKDAPAHFGLGVNLGRISHHGFGRAGLYRLRKNS